jgi:hypothetical protein
MFIHVIVVTRTCVMTWKYTLKNKHAHSVILPQHTKVASYRKSTIVTLKINLHVILPPHLI